MKISKTIKLVVVLVVFSSAVDLFAVQKYIPIPEMVVETIQTLAPSHSTPQVQPEAAKQTTLIFTGDINLGRCVSGIATRASDYTFPFRNVADKLRSADITVGSLDASLSNVSPPQDCPTSMNLIGPENMVQGLQFAGFDVITIATNHVKDCGDEGFYCNNRSFFDTLNTLSQAGIQPVGGGKNLSEARKPVIIEKQGIRFAFLGIDQINSKVWATDDTPGVTPLRVDTVEQIKSDIKSAKAIADVVIVMPHWGTEYSAQPNDIQREWARQFIEAGATLIIGNHPHIIQPRESFSNGTAFYALGNFVFDQGQNFRRQGLVVQAIFKGSYLDSLQLIPIDINYYTHQPYWTQEPESQKILLRVEDLSQ